MGPSRLAAMAWRNLWRNPRRTVITLFSVAFAVFLAVLMTGLQDHSWASVVDTAARLGNGHVTVMHPEQLEKPSLARTITVDAAALEAIRAVPGVTHAGARITGQVMLATALDSAGAAFTAYDPATETPATLSILEAVREGHALAPADTGGMLVGERLARNLGARVGSKVVFTLTDRRGEMVSGLARVTGILRTGSPSVDLGLVYLPIGAVRETLGYGPMESTHLAVLLEDQRKADAVADVIRNRVAGARAYSWRETQPDLVGMIAMKRGGTTFFEVLVLLLCAAGIFNTLFVSVMERVREFGILAAVGMGEGRMFALVMLESLWVALAGLVLAAGLTAWPYHFLSTTGVDLSAKVGAQQADVAGIGMSMVMKVGITGDHLLQVAVVSVLATLLAGLYPAWRASHVAPVEAIKLV